MTSVAAALAPLARRLADPPEGRAQLIVTLSARDDAARHPIARALALAVADHAPRPVWLIDADFGPAPHAKAFLEASGLGDPLDLGLGGPGFWRVADEDGEWRERLGAVALHPVEGANLLVSRFRAEAFGEAPRITVIEDRAYWKNARTLSGCILIDAPARIRSAAGMAFANVADAGVFVVEPGAAGERDVDALAREWTERGGQEPGVILAEGRPHAPDDEAAGEGEATTGEG